jgi:Mlc titration factor MtfA (ptsG expression regulator)
MRFGSRRKRDEVALEFTDEWRATLRAGWPLWRQLADDERARIEALTLRFLASKRWEAANGFELTEPMRVLIAAQACLLLLGYDAEGDGDVDAMRLYQGVGSILVHPTTLLLEGHSNGGFVNANPYAIDGQAAFGGPTIVAWDAVTSDAKHPARGQNVVYHEFAHKLDMLDGVLDGTPPLLEAGQRERWVEVCTREFRAVTRGVGGPLIRDYAAENPGEFFAVVSELFFCRPVDLREQKPDLYEVLSAFYRQDPAARFPSAAAAAG